MSIYLLQHRALQLKSGRAPTKFPAAATASITFGPEDAFGVQTSGARSTAPKARPAGLLWNANEGTFEWNVELIDRINTSFERENFKASINGNNLVLDFNAHSLEHAHQVIASANQFLPALLSFRLRVFVWVKKFELEIGDARFNFEIPRSFSHITIATMDRNTDQILSALDEWLAADDRYFRILSALYYYRHAERLSVMEPNRESMLAEVILNLGKAAEVLFSTNRETVRATAKEWGFDELFMERRIIPLLLIRNELDVAHVTTAPLHPEQREIITRFTHAALLAVHKLLERILMLAREGNIDIQPASARMGADKEKLLQNIRRYLDPPSIDEGHNKSELSKRSRSPHSGAG